MFRELGDMTAKQRSKLPQVWRLVKILMEYPTIDTHFVKELADIIEEEYGPEKLPGWRERIT